MIDNISCEIKEDKNMPAYGEARVIKVDEMEAMTDIPKHKMCSGYPLVPKETGVSFSFSLAEIHICNLENALAKA
jgi:hypothetical protein